MIGDHIIFVGRYHGDIGIIETYGSHHMTVRHIKSGIVIGYTLHKVNKEGGPIKWTKNKLDKAKRK